VRCGALIVPERRGEGADPERTLRLPFVVIESLSAEPAPDPLVFPTSGGPGGGSLSALWYFLDHADWAGDRDIIVIEQRGDLAAEPTLDCPELHVAERVEDGALVTGAAADAQRRAQLEACRARLVEEGVDVTAYTSTASAADLADLRAALEYDQWNLYGVSYGARLAMTVMRDQPAGLRAVILDGAYPPNVNRFEQTPAGLRAAVDRLLVDCAADAECDERYPDLDRSLQKAFDRVEESPVTVEVKSPGDRAPVRVEVGDQELAQGLFDAFYDAGLVRVLPFLIDQVAQGADEVILPLAQQSIDVADHFAEGLDLSIECAEEAPFNDDALIDEAYAADDLVRHLDQGDLRSDCEVWAVPALGAGENQPVSSAIPTLLAVGGYDPITPLPWSEAAATGLSQRYLYEFPTMGHGAVWANGSEPCPAQIAAEFLTEPTVEPDSSCIARMPAIDFVTTADIDPTSAVYRLDSDLLRDRDPVQIGITVLLLLLLLGTVVYGVVYGLQWLARRRGEAPSGAVAAASAAAGLNLVFVGALALVMFNADPIVLAFGLPPGFWPLLLLPFLALATTLILIGLLVRAWMQRDSSLGHRVALSVAALALMGFAAWLLSRGLLTL
jgi:pimeloyl-ACP methyl ester carboxylesterase